MQTIYYYPLNVGPVYEVCGIIHVPNDAWASADTDDEVSKVFSKIILAIYNFM